MSKVCKELSTVPDAINVQNSNADYYYDCSPYYFIP